MTDISFPSTGNADEDDEIARRIILTSERLKNNVCANGCMGMVWIDPYNRECLKCGFKAFSSKPYDIDTGSIH